MTELECMTSNYRLHYVQFCLFIRNGYVHWITTNYGYLHYLPWPSDSIL